MCVCSDEQNGKINDQVDEIVMIGEDILGKLFSCMGQKDDTLAKELLAGKVRTEPQACPRHARFFRSPAVGSQAGCTNCCMYVVHAFFFLVFAWPSLNVSVAEEAD